MRSPGLAQLTKDNLGIYNYFFHNHYFGEGNKQQYLIDNPSTTFWVIDNEDKGYSAYDNVIGFTHVASWDTTPMTTTAAPTYTTYIIAIITAITLMAVLTTGAIAAPQEKEDTCPTKQEQGINFASGLTCTYPTRSGTTMPEYTYSTRTTHCGVMSLLASSMVPSPSRSIHSKSRMEEAGHANYSPLSIRQSTVLQRLPSTVSTAPTSTSLAGFLAEVLDRNVPSSSGTSSATNSPPMQGRSADLHPVGQNALGADWASGQLTDSLSYAGTDERISNDLSRTFQRFGGNRGGAGQEQGRLLNTTQDPLLYVGAGGLSILLVLLTLWAAFYRHPLFLKGGIMAIIALVLSLLISVAPVTEFATFEAIDAPSIELAHSTPQIPEIFIRDHQTAPQMRKLRTGEWSICGGVHSGLFADACGWWPSGSSPSHLFGAVVAVLAIAASLMYPTEGMEGVSMAGLGLFFTVKIGDGDDTFYMDVVTPRSRVLNHCQALGKVFKQEKKPLVENLFERIMKGRDGVFNSVVSGRDLTTDVVRSLFPTAGVIRSSRTEYILVHGMTNKEFADFLRTQITTKLGRKYLLGLFARIVGSGIAEPNIDVIDLPRGGDGDGCLRYKDASQLQLLGIEIAADQTEIRTKIWHSTLGLIKGLFVLTLDPSVERLTYETSLKDNQKGCLEGVAGFANVQCITHTWQQEKRWGGKAANIGPMTVCQMGQKSYDHCIDAAELSLTEDVHQCLDSLVSGKMDATQMEAREQNVSNEIVARDELRVLLALATLPVATFGSLLRYLKPFIENWKGTLATIEKACENRDVRFRLPHSNIAPVISEGTFRRYLEITSPGKYVPLAKRGLSTLFSYGLRLKVLCEKYYARAIKLWDAGDFDGDTQVDADIAVESTETCLKYRNPCGPYDFDLLEREETDVPLHAKRARNLAGEWVDLEPLSFEGTTDCITLVDVTEHEDENMPKGALTGENFDEWQDVVSLNTEAAMPIGQYALTQTTLMSHDKKATLPHNNFVVDGDIQCTACAKTSGEVTSLVEEAQRAFEEGDAIDEAMFAWAKMELNGYTIEADPKDRPKDAIYLRPVRGSFYRLVEAMVNQRNKCAAWLEVEYRKLLSGGQRNSQPIIAACEAAGLVADLEKGQRGVAYVNAGNSLALLRRLDEMEPRDAAEAVFSMYCYIDSQKNMFDSALFHAPNVHPGTKYQTVAAYLVAFLINNDNQDPNPDGDGSNPKEGGDMDSVDSGAMNEHTQFEVLDNMNMGELAQICRDNGVKGWSKYRSLAKKADLIRFIIDNTDDGDDDDNTPTPPNGGGVVEDHYGYATMYGEGSDEWLNNVAGLDEGFYSTDGDDNNDDNNPTPPDGGGDGPEEIIPGLTLQENFVTEDEERQLVKDIDAGTWDKSMRRWVQHFGYAYDYLKRLVTKESYLGPLPGWSTTVVDRVTEMAGSKPDQIIVNEYKGNQGIAAHVDCKPCFTDKIVSVSLLEAVFIVFRNTTTGEVKQVLLPARSCLVMSGEARYKWTHEIKQDHLGPDGTPRKRRLSLTLRNVIIDGEGPNPDGDGSQPTQPETTDRPKHRLPLFYAGIGSRYTPVEIQKVMTKVAQFVDSEGWTLRSGGAKGADTAFESGATKKETFTADSAVPQEAVDSVDKYHPNVPALNAGKYAAYARKLMARTWCQIFGSDRNQKISQFVVCWAKGWTLDEEGAVKDVPGGTGQAVRIAYANGIPVFHLGIEGHKEELFHYIERWRSDIDQTAPAADEAGRKEDKLSQIKEFAYNGKNVKLKVAKDGRHYFVVDGQMHWISQKFLGEESQRNLGKVRDLWTHSHQMFTQGVASDFFRSIGLAALLFAVLLGIDVDGEAVFAAAPLFFRNNAMAPNCILKEAVQKAEKAAEVTFRALVKAEDKAEIAKAVGVAEAIQETSTAEWRCLQEWETAMESLWQASKDLDAGEAMTSKVTSVTKPRESIGRDRCGKRRTHRVSGNDYIVCCEGCSPGYCPKSNNLIEPGDLVAFHWIG